MTEKRVYSDATQLATLRQAQRSVEKDHGLGPRERDYHSGVLDALIDRVEESMQRKRAKEQEARGR
ncbi:MAG TPA: hypothetical protein VIF61_00260 [Methylocystis sp.]